MQGIIKRALTAGLMTGAVSACNLVGSLDTKETNDLPLTREQQADKAAEYSSRSALFECPLVFERGVMSLDVNPAFVEPDHGPEGGDGLTVSSFFNTFIDPQATPPLSFFERDLVGRIEGLSDLDPNSFDATNDFEVITDLDFTGPGLGRTVWPNEAFRAPQGVFPFDAIVIPQGFHPAAAPGRLTVVDLSDPEKTEYVVHQSTQAPGGFTFPGDPGNSPRFYHRVVFMDMDGDGLKDLVTVRSGFRVGPSIYPPFGELVYFRNPGEALDPNTPWDEVVLFGGQAAGFLGPDVQLAAHDFEGDGIPEIVATHFFSGFAGDGQGPPPTNGRIAIYGAPEGGSWADVNAALFQLPRVATLSDDQGFPFDIEIVDLNGDGSVDILATNHQPDNCSPATSSAIPGRVYALEQPADGDVFGSPWTTHILMDDIRPQPTPAPLNPPGRLAPGRAHTFYPVRFFEGLVKPWIVVGGDEAGKVWVLRPTRWFDDDSWDYHSSVVFDINDHYGEGTTQTPMVDPFGITISTIGGVGVRYNRPDVFGWAELYIPVFEGRDIHVLSFAFGDDLVQCPDDVTLQCEAPQ